MTRRLYDFRCPEGHVAEAFVSAEIKHIRCICGQEATRIISPINFQLNGADSGWPTAHDKWVREHERAGKINKS